MQRAKYLLMEIGRKGRLTDVEVNQIQAYYGKTIGTKGRFD